MRKRLSQIFRINPNESWFVQSFFLHHLFQGFGLAVFFTTASVIFLARFSAQNLPLIYVLSALFMLLGGQLYSNLQQYISLERLMQGIVLHYTIVHCFSKQCIIMLGSVLHYTIVHYIARQCIIMQGSVLHYTIVNYIAIQCIIMLLIFCQVVFSPLIESARKRLQTGQNCKILLLFSNYQDIHH